MLGTSRGQELETLMAHPAARMLCQGPPHRPPGKE